MHPRGIFLAHHHLTLLISRTIHLQRLWSSGYTLSAKKDGEKFMVLLFGSSKGVKTEEKPRAWLWCQQEVETLGDTARQWSPTESCREGHREKASLPDLSTAPVVVARDMGALQHHCPPPIQMVARETQMMATQAIANLCTIGSCLAGTMTLDCYWFSVCLWDRDVRNEVSSRFLNSFKTTISWTFLATLPSVHCCLHSVYFI